MATEFFGQTTERSFTGLWNGKTACRVENEWVLPDYKEAAQRLIRVDADPCITGKRLYRKGQDLVCEIEGSVFLHILYTPEGENGEKYVLSFETKEPFFASFQAPLREEDTPDPDNIVILAEGTGENVNARLLGPRRLAVRCDVSLALELRGNRPFAVCGGEMQEDIQVLTGETENTVLSGVSRWDFRLAETVKLPAAYLPVREMVDLSVTMFADRVKSGSGTVDFLGHLVVNAAYTPEGETGIISFCQPFEFEKSVGDLAVQENDLCEVTLTPVVLQASVEMNEGGENKNLTLDVAYTAEIRSYRQETLRFCRDLYSLKSEVTLQTDETALRNMVAVRDFSKEVRTTLPLRRASFSRAEDIRATLRFNDSYREGEELKVDATLLLKYLAVGEDGTITAAEDSAEIRFDLPDQVNLPGDDGHVEIVGGISDAELYCREDEIEVRIGVYGRVGVYRERSIQYISSASRGEDLVREKRGLLFYYPDSGETLWEICKHYHADANEVRLDNGWEDDSVPGTVRIILR